jgi:glyoxylase-like metal-dependent hydrolase (beta-lactamase superfamily II)
LFTGDHVGYDADLQALDGFRPYNHGNIQLQKEYLESLADDNVPFTWVLPGHGRMIRFANLEDKKTAFLACATTFESSRSPAPAIDETNHEDTDEDGKNLDVMNKIVKDYEDPLNEDDFEEMKAFFRPKFK